MSTAGRRRGSGEAGKQDCLRKGSFGYVLIRLCCFAALILVTGIPLTADSAAGQSSGIRTYCNPIDIDYKYNFEQINEGISYRSGADPVIINHQGEYYLFVTASGGYWHSKDLLHWQFVTPSRWPFGTSWHPLLLQWETRCCS